MWRQAARSAGGSMMAFGSFLATSRMADEVFEPKLANGVGLAIGSAVNLLFQLRVFAPGSSMESVLVRYLLAEATILSVQQGVFLVLFGLRERIADTLAIAENDELLLAGLRIASQASVFAGLSFPLRRYWVFANAAPAGRTLVPQTPSTASSTNAASAATSMMPIGAPTTPRGQSKGRVENSL
mmetsp:Transcript_31350/g.73124  ORF Transcript_31350/g.73124 Transcript_31350/m.73124 type:complete len:184 (+) Transcript_31350:194-745(+)